MVSNIFSTASDFHWKVAHIAQGSCMKYKVQGEQVVANMKAIRGS